MDALRREQEGGDIHVKAATGPVGRQVISAGSPSTVPSTPKSLSLGGLGSITGPTFVVQAKDTAASVLATAKLKAIGSLTLVNMPVNLTAASLADTARVGAGKASATKSVSIGNLSLPSLSELLAALGLDLPALLDELGQDNLTQLAGLVSDTSTGAVKTANDAVDSAQAALTSAGQTPAQAQSDRPAFRGGVELTAAQATATQANSDFASAWSTAYGALAAPAKAILDTALTTAGLSGATLTADQWNAMDATMTTAMQTAMATISAGTFAALDALAVAAGDAENVVTLVNSLIDALQSLIDAVLGAVTGNDDPLAALGGITVTTKAVAAGTPSAAAGVHVGTVDVLGAATQLSALSGALAEARARTEAASRQAPRPGCFRR